VDEADGMLLLEVVPGVELRAERWPWGWALWWSVCGVELEVDPARLGGSSAMN
jgi:hypothetical protein